MSEKMKAIPEGFHSLTPHLTVRDAAKAIEFYQRAFGAEVRRVIPDPKGKVIHADLKIGDSILMLNDEFPEWGSLSPLSLKGTSVTIHVFAEDVDVAFDRAVKAGATVTMPLQNQFWGDRYGKVKDPFGHEWSFAMQVEQLSPEEIAKRSEAFFAQTHK